MVILFSNRKSRLEKEITEILTACGADFISDKSVSASGGFFTVAICYKPTEINVEKAVVLFLDNSEKYKNQILPNGVIGICDNKNTAALNIFQANKVAVVTCGNNSKNTVTISSIEKNCYLVTLQRQITDLNGNTHLPSEYKLELARAYSIDAVMQSAAILQLLGIAAQK